MKNSEGFSPANITNLPRVETIMMLHFMMSSDKYNEAGIRGAKASLSSRTSYVENAVGYVEVKRENNVCYLQCRVSPEQKVRNKMYKVSAEIDEDNDYIIDICCHDCPASDGGCKHAICFLMWLVKRTEEPSTTSTTCYWNKPKLSAAVTNDKFILVSAIGKRKSYTTDEEVPTLQDFLNEAKKHKIGDCLLLAYNNHQPSLNDFCVFNLMLEFTSDGSIIDKSFENYKRYASKKISPENVALLEKKTRSQVSSKLWHSLRQYRVTASKIYEATRCQTENGALVQSIMGGYKVPETAAIKRGKRLEGEVVKEVEKDLGVVIEKSGFILISPLIGASPDGISNDFVVEVKCPTSIKTMKNYVKQNIMSKKCQAQIQLQMYAAKKTKGLFCIADPTFEQTRKVHKHWVTLNANYVKKLISKGENFWEKFLFKNVLECCK